MKSLTAFRMINNIFSLCLLLLLIIISSCSKEEVSQQIITEDLTQLTVSIDGIDEDSLAVEETTDDVENNASARRATVPRNIQTTASKELSFDGFDAMTSVEDDGFATELTYMPRVRSSSSTGNQMITTLPAGIRYRILLYRANGTFWNSTEAVSGTALNIPVARGETYTWYAYSYNDNQTVANVADTNNPTIPTGTTRDLITASGVIPILTSGSTHLSIIFQHRTNRVGLEINTMGMFSNLNAVTLTLGGNYFTSGTYNIRTGLITGSATYTTPSMTAANLVRPANYTFGDRNVAYFYTTSLGAIPNVQATISNLSVTPSNNTTRTFTNTANFTFNFTPFISLGRSKTATINLIESPLTVAGIRWARSNLYLFNNSITSQNPYRFYPTNNIVTAREGYFPWRGLTPEGLVGSGDPCTRVYPLNTWRTPNPTELRALQSTAYLFLGPANNTQNVQYAATGTGSPYPNNNLVLPYNGQSAAVSTLGIPNQSFSLTENNLDTYIWSNLTTLTTGGVDLEVDYYRAGRAPYVQFFTVAHEETPTVAVESNEVITLGGFGVLSSGYKNVRCVRTN